MIWRPRKTLGIAAGLVIGAMLLLALATVRSSLRSPSDDTGIVATVLLLALTVLAMAHWLVRLYGLMTLHYRLDRNALIIHYGAHQHTIPLNAITRIVPAQNLSWPKDPPQAVWPGYHAESVIWDSARTMWIHGTASPSDHLVVMTDATLYAISPANPERFLEDFNLRRSLGPVRSPAQETTAVGIAAWQVWWDKPYWSAVGVALLANLALYGLTLGTHRPIAIPALRWLPDQSIVAGIGSAILACNLLLGAALYRVERVATWLLMIVGLLSQVLLACSALL